MTKLIFITPDFLATRFEGIFLSDDRYEIVASTQPDRAVGT